MGRVEYSVEVAAPVEKVFAFATDWKCMEKIGPKDAEIKVEKLTEGPIGIGTKWRISGIMVGRKMDDVVEYVEFEENRRVRTRLVSSNTMKRFYVTAVFEATDGGTKYTEIWDYELPYGVLGKLIDKLKVRKDIQHFLNAILEKGKEILEKG